jgi:NADH dehydrogenase (ubiquinone) 1 alpha subcomplex subunit 9
MRPVHALDVAKALANLAAMPPVARSINLPGPETFDIDYLLELVSSVTYNPPSGAPQLPKSLAKLISQISKFVWWPVLSEDQIERRFIDDSAVSGDWDVVDVNPDQLKAHALTYLQIYRSQYVVFLDC